MDRQSSTNPITSYNSFDEIKHWNKNTLLLANLPFNNYSTAKICKLGKFLKSKLMKQIDTIH